jgi:predicted transcriptional regulator
MATIKVTFTLDDDTIARLRATAERLAIPKSEVVREAIRDFSDRAGRLSERQRRRLIEAFDRLVPKIPARPLRDVERELAELRRSRRAGGRQLRPGPVAR